MDDLPMCLGLCRRCSKLKVLNETTLEGRTLRRVYYCRVAMHETVGTGECNDFMEVER